MEYFNEKNSFNKYLKEKFIKERISNRMYKILWEKKVTYNGNIITLETLKYKNWTIKDSFKNIRKLD